MSSDLASRASVIIPVRDQSFFTRVCLLSLGKEQEGAEIIVVDNGSADETPELLRRWSSEGPHRHAVRLEENTGFAAGCNTGAEQASREYLIFLNNDTVVLEGWLTNLLQPLTDPDTGITGSRLLYPSGHVQHAGIAFDEHGPWHVFVGMPGGIAPVMKRRDLQAVTGASLAIRKSDFERLGGFDTVFQNSFEDIDLCLRVRQEGRRVVYVPDSVAYHFEGMTEGRVAPTDRRNYDLFTERWRGRYEYDVAALHREAEAAGYDLDQRVLSRRELQERDRLLQERTAELMKLRRLAGMRSVRAAVWLHDHVRRVLPARPR